MTNHNGKEYIHRTEPLTVQQTLTQHCKSATWSEMKATQPCLTLWDSMNYPVHGILQARILEWVAFPFSRASSQPRDRAQVSCIAGGFLTSWAIGKPKDTGVGSLSLLQWIFQTQELNQGLLHCKWILYQLSYDIYWISIMFWAASRGKSRLLVGD